MQSKTELLPSVAALVQMRYKLYASLGTAEFYKAHDIQVGFAETGITVVGAFFQHVLQIVNFKCKENTRALYAEYHIIRK